MPPLVTVVVAAYNAASYVREAIQSVLDQDYPAKEVVVVNDGSTDDTLRILATFGDAIRVIDQPNGGPPKARNSGLRAAKGEYVAFLDADDRWLPGKLSAQVADLEAHPDIGINYTAWQTWPPDADGCFRVPSVDVGDPSDRTLDEDRSGWRYDALLFDCELLTTTVMLRTSLVRKIGEFDTRLFNGDDYDYWLRASRLSQIHKLRRIGALYREQPGSISRTPRAVNFEAEVIRRAIARWGLTSPGGRAADRRAIEQRIDELQLQHGYGHLYAGDPRVAFRIFRQMLGRHPARVKLWAYLALAVVKMGRW